ncbi:MAG: TadE/TadG family type IV pilus assembly protein [Rhizobiaceae bacterium]|jgi:Flp pilus assembly protein TadG
MARTVAGNRNFRQLARCRTGTSAVEFAIVSPLLILLLFGMVAYGLYLGASHSIQQIAADTARTAVAGLNENDRISLAETYIERNADAYPLVERSKLSFDIRDNPADANEFIVAIRYDARDLPIWNLLPDLPLPGMTIRHSSTIRIGGK